MYLAPKVETLKKYKDGLIDDIAFTEAYTSSVLNRLDPVEIYEYLLSNYGEDVTLLCYEKRGEFCHRRLVAKWLETANDVTIAEL